MGVYFMLFFPIIPQKVRILQQIFCRITIDKLNQTGIKIDVNANLKLQENAEEIL